MASTSTTVPALQYHQATGSYTETTSLIQNDPFTTRTSPYKYLPFPYSATITLASRNVSYTPNTLGTTTHIYTSPQYDDVINLAQYFADWGCSYSVQEGATHTITVQAPWDTVSYADWDVSLYASEQWELVPQAGVKNIMYSGLLANSFTSPTYAGNYVTLPLGLQAAVQVANKNGNTFLNVTGSLLTPTQKTNYAPYVPYANTTLMYMKAGIEGIPSYTQILKRTAVIDINNVNNAFQTNVDNQRNSINAQGTINFIYSTNQLLNSYAIPSDTVGKLLLPSYRKKIGVVNIDPTQYTVYAGWLVKPPTIQFIGRNKLQMTQEFVWDEWADKLYYINSPATDFPLVYSSSLTT